jgi:hypothetical protein
MAMQFAVSTRDARLDAIETDIGQSAKLAIYSGAMPADCASDTTGTLLAEFDLAASGDWAAAASGAKSLANLPLSTTGAAAGTAGYFRLFASGQSTTPGAGTPCHLQGTVTATGGGGDMILDNTSIASGQTVNITSFTITDGNA